MRAADLFLVAGFALFVGGVAMWSVPSALCVAGAVLFVSGGLMAQREPRMRKGR